MKTPSTLLILATLALLLCCNKETDPGKMTLTFHSDQALDHYRQAYLVACKVVDLEKAAHLYEMALEEDPSFFMARYQLATFHLFHGNDSLFTLHARNAVQHGGRLTDGEKMLRQVLESLLEDRNADAPAIGRELTEQFPGDPDAWINLGFFCYLKKEYGGAAAAFEKALSLERKEGEYCGPKLAIVPICMLGYTYLVDDEPDKARAAFDQYIRQNPDEPNPYDCMADYFMSVGEYDKAFENYMTAFRIDTAYDVYRQRAVDALMRYDSRQKQHD